MRVLLVGAGGVGGAAAAIAVRRGFLERLVVADYDLDRARAVVDRLGDPRLQAIRLDASDEAAVAAALAGRSRAAQRHRPTLRHAPVPRGARGRGDVPGHGDVAVRA